VRHCGASFGVSIILRLALGAGAALPVLGLGGCDRGGKSYAGAYTEADFSAPDLAGGDLVVAEIGGKPITAGFLKHKLRIQLPDMAQEGPSMALQARETLQRVIVEECFNKLGRERGYDLDPEFLRTMYLSRSYILTNLTASRAVYARTQPSDEEVRRYYDENPDRFIVKAQSWYRHILVPTESQAWEIYRRIKNGESFDELARQYSKDESSARNGGVMPPMTPGYAAGRLGKVPELGEKVLSMKEGELGEPIHSVHGWHVVRVDAVRQEHTRPFEEVRAEIVQKLSSRGQAELYTVVLDSLKAAYNVHIDDEALKEFYVLQMTDEQLFEEAQSEADNAQKVYFYQKLIDRFPQSTRVPEALFMIGYVQAEALGDTAKAVQVFRDFLDRYPEHEMAPSARLMVEELSKPTAR
jgi:peptidyl-prolyl cis-trans isomerase C